jgi:hypothetical protein
VGDDPLEIPRRRTGVWVIVGLLVFAAAAVVVWRLSRPSPCVEAADRLCALASIGEGQCRPIRETLAGGKVPEARCREAAADIEAVSKMHWTEQSGALSVVLGKLLGMEAAMQPIHEGALRLEHIRMEIEGGRVDEQAKRELEEVGPVACAVVLARWRRSDDPMERRVLREVMARWQGGDLGEAPEAWQGWCAEVVHRAASGSGTPR